MLQWSYCVPVTLLLVRGRGLLDVIHEEEERKSKTPDDQSSTFEARRFNLGKFGYIVNLWGVLFAIFTSIL
jgi:hypothetical protein